MENLDKDGDGIICLFAVIIRDKKVLLGLRNYTADKWKDISVWTAPGGRSEKGETLRETLTREVKEEVDITDLKIEKFLGETPGAKEGDVVHLYLCSTGQEAKLMEPEKFSEWRWFGANEIPENFINKSGLRIINKLLV